MDFRDSPDEAAFQKSVRVSFPDKSAIGPGDLPLNVVATELGRRIVGVEQGALAALLMVGISAFAIPTLSPSASR